MKWRTVPLEWKVWDDGKLAFNIGSGTTHLLSPTAASVLEALERKACDPAEVASWLSGGKADETDSELLGRVDELLSKLDALGLIELVE